MKNNAINTIINALLLTILAFLDLQAMNRPIEGPVAPRMSNSAQLDTTDDESDDEMDNTDDADSDDDDAEFEFEVDRIEPSDEQDGGGDADEEDNDEFNEGDDNDGENI